MIIKSAIVLFGPALLLSLSLSFVCICACCVCVFIEEVSDVCANTSQEVCFLQLQLQTIQDLGGRMLRINLPCLCMVRCVMCSVLCCVGGVVCVHSVTYIFELSGEVSVSGGLVLPKSHHSVHVKTKHRRKRTSTINNGCT